MKKYLKPEIEEEIVEIEDIVATSPGLDTQDQSPIIGDSNDPDSEGFGGSN
ncbi:MAG: hypothetical protein IKP77_03500 [Acholeplasmatales bacterium]|nr:hypothetical protein [Acholeplasmatales bacterium]